MSNYNEYQSEYSSDAGSVFSYSNKNGINKFVNTYTGAPDKLCFKISRTVETGPYRSEKRKIIIYGSGQQGTCIRNAVTGERYTGQLVGSANECRYYKVGLCTGEVGGRDTVTLFYDYPEQYESHMRGEISTKAKKSIAAEQRRSLAEQEYNERTERNGITVK